MPEIGRTLSHFRITDKIGQGGMGEVYQATDTKLGRKVAIKVLPEEFAQDAERVARFQREAKLLASLNHPNIAAIYGLEESGGTNFLVLELVEGSTLDDRIKSGPIPVEETLNLALQISEALEAAHEKGVIHRDLKPANIKVTPDGKVKVLDFGLAKAFAGEQADPNLSNSPTLSDMATQKGLILGTAAYMSPEQARGKPVDKRTDIWAFGCVLYEMLTGKAAFQGEDVTEILAAVVKSGVNLNLLPANTHPRVREVIIRCLTKEQKKRYRDIGEAQYEIEQVLADPNGVLAQPVAVVESRKGLSLKLPWVAAMAILCLIVGGMIFRKLKPAEPKQIVRFDYQLPEDQNFSNISDPALAISPAGKQFVYSTPSGLYLRSIDELTARLIAGTEESVAQPFFSPDGKWIGYFSTEHGELKKISVDGGTPVPLCHVAGPFKGAWWGDDNNIVFSQSPGDIMRISANGGDPESFVKANNAVLIFPQVLTDEKTILYSRGPSPWMIVARSLKSGKSKELFPGKYARYYPTGHIVYRTEGNADIFAVPFDPDKLEVTGGAVPVVGDAIRGESSRSGTLVYIPGTQDAASDFQRSLVWVDREGKEESVGAQPNFYRFPSISPDGTKVALVVIARGSGKADISVWDLDRKNLMPLTFEGAYNITPLWSPDGKRIAFFSSHLGEDAKRTGIYWKAADGTGKDEQLCSIPEPDVTFMPYGWMDAGKTLVGVKSLGTSMLDIEMLRLEADKALRPLLAERYNELQPKISPDSRWVAYTSNESGRNEIYVRPLPDVNQGRFIISTDGGNSPLWSPDGCELFYRNSDEILAVSIKTDPDFSIVGTPRTLFKGTFVEVSGLEGNPWDISPDGRRFLMIKPGEGTPAGIPRKINVVLNWFEELKNRVPAD